MVNAYLKHQEEAHHERPEFVAYEHLRKRDKVFIDVQIYRPKNVIRENYRIGDLVTFTNLSRVL